MSKSSGIKAVDDVRNYSGAVENLREYSEAGGESSSLGHPPGLKSLLLAHFARYLPCLCHTCLCHTCHMSHGKRLQEYKTALTSTF